MKYLYVVIISLAVISGSLVLLKTPIMKIPTPVMVSTIKRDFVRSDLTSGEERVLNDFLEQITYNQKTSYEAYQYCAYCIIILSLITILQNIYLIRQRRR
jgi:hypothetical protein